MLMADIFVELVRMAKIPSKFVLHLVDQVESLLRDCDSFLLRVVEIIKNFEVWASILRILNCYA